MNTRVPYLLMAAAVALSTSSAGADDAWFPYAVESWDPPFDMASPRTSVDYVPLAQASNAWEICVSFPHMMDAYWLGRQLWRGFRGGTPGREDASLSKLAAIPSSTPRSARSRTVWAAGADAVVIGAISYDGLNNLVGEIRGQGIPVIDVINGMSSPELSAKSLVSFGEMGGKTGEYLAGSHPAGSDPVKVAWFPGPAGAGWVEAGNAGFIGAVEGSAVEVVDTRYGDTGKEAQSALVEDALETHPDLDYIAGTAVTAEAAIPILRSRGLADQISVLSYYFTPGVDQGISRGQILAAPTDSPVISGADRHRSGGAHSRRG